MASFGDLDEAEARALMAMPSVCNDILPWVGKRAGGLGILRWRRPARFSRKRSRSVCRSVCFEVGKDRYPTDALQRI